MIYVCTLTNSKDIVLNGKDIIMTTEELYKHITDTKCTGLEIKSDFVHKYYTDSSLQIEIDNIRKLNPRINIQVDYKTKQESDISLMSELKDVEDFISWAFANKNEAFEIYQNLCKEHNKKVNTYLEANAKVNELNLAYIDVKKEKEDEVAKCKNLQRQLEDVSAKYNSLLSKINMNYNVGITSKYLEPIKLSVNAYQKILYIKEVTRVTYVDTFIYYLKEILRSLYSVPARLLVMESPLGYSRAYMYPECKNSLNLNIGDVYNKDIFVAGYSEELVKDVLKNPNRQPYLVVLDRTDWRDTFITGTNVETYYTASDIQDLIDFQDLEHIISYNNNTLHIDYIEDFDKLEPQEKIIKYSSMDIMKKTINLLEGSSTSVEDDDYE